LSHFSVFYFFKILISTFFLHLWTVPGLHRHNQVR